MEIVSVIDTKKLGHLMPHRDPMIWVDNVLSFSEHTGEFSVTLKSDRPYFQNKDLIQSFYLEFLAQGYGFVKAAYVDSQIENLNIKMDKALIPMIDKYDVMPEAMNIKEQDIVFGEVKTIRDLFPLFLVEANAFDENKRLLANARFKVFSVVEEL